VVRVQVFVNYRRDSDRLRAMLVETQLKSAVAQFRPHSLTVFRDNSIRLGQNWPQELRTQLDASDIVLAVIGPAWLSSQDEFGRRRIDQPDDWVRRELEVALDSDKAVVPVVFGQSLPPKEGLPPSLMRLHDVQAAFVTEITLERDLEPLHQEVIEVIDQSRTTLRSHPAGGQLPYPQPPMKLPPAPIPADDLESLLAEDLPDWRIVSGPAYAMPHLNAVELRREYKFGAFKDAIRFMSEVADFADEANHHPRWENIFRTLIVNLTTWDIGHKVSVLDIMFASYLDRKFRAYTERTR
jgi:pterin-4a-carbinolamine dehydratase